MDTKRLLSRLACFQKDYGTEFANELAWRYYVNGDITYKQIKRCFYMLGA